MAHHHHHHHEHKEHQDHPGDAVIRDIVGVGGLMEDEWWLDTKPGKGVRGAHALLTELDEVGWDEYLDG